METPKHQSSTRVGTSLGETAAPSPTAFVMKPPTQPLGTVPPRKPPEMGADRLRRPSFPMAGLKPIAEGIRRVPPFGSPKREGQHDSNEAKRRRRSVVRLIHPTAELMPVSIDRGAGGVSRRSGWGAHGRPGIASLRPTADRASRGPLNRFAGAFAGVRRHRIGGSRRRVSDTSARGLSDAAKGGEPAYSLGPRFAVPRRRLAGGLAPSDPPHRQRRIVSAGRASEAERAEWPARARSRKGWPPLRRRRFIRATPARPSSRGASGAARGTVPGHGKGKRADNNGRRDERAGRPLAFPRAVVRLLEAALDGLPARTAGWERPRSGGEDGAVTAPSSPMPIEACRDGGSLPSTAKERGSASAFRWPWCNRKRASDMGRRRRVPSQARFRVRPPPKCHGHSWIGIGRTDSGPGQRLPSG